jgi:L-alanine-DL-glutamate epimerase-like enolase superfamily enzyme
VDVDNIYSIEIFHAKLKLKQPFITSLGYRDHANNVIVRIKTSNGIVGWGECSPYAPINGETVDTCFVVGKMLSEQLIGKNALDVKAASKQMDKVIYGNTSIKCALDIALHDIAAKHKGVPLYKFLGGKIKKKIYTDYTVSVSNVPQMVADALTVKERGFPIMKVKLGQGGKEDIVRIHEIRKAVGDKIEIRIDANQGWKPAEALETLSALKPYRIQYCEEPISKQNYLKLDKIIKNSPIKIMADESVSDHYDARKMLKLGLCDYINIKLGKSSGFIKAKKIVKIADKAGIKMQIGGFLESRILFTANVHLAHTSDLITFFDFDSPLFHEIDPVIGGMEYHKDWEITLPESPGLGLSVDEDFLKKMRGITIS